MTLSTMMVTSTWRRKRDGFGSMFNFIRGSVYLAVTGNLTYVHHPLRATHGADVASLDRVLGLPTASRCDAVCAERMIAPSSSICGRMSASRATLLDW